MHCSRMNTAIAGNIEDKYHTSNPIYRRLVADFTLCLKELLLMSGTPNAIVEIGAGEGEIALVLRAMYPSATIEATDVSEAILEIAARGLVGTGISTRVEDAQDLSYQDDSFDLVVCCEVLEHVADPGKALREIRRVAKDKAIFSVPQEPIWRVLNCLRGRYLASLGNTPGHLNHWSAGSFIRLFEQAGFNVIATRLPFPWTMVLAGKAKP